jgi:hypothetical protein
VVLPLRGQPFANREVQSPPPAEDAQSWFDLRAFANEAQLPKDRDMMSSVALVTPSGVAWLMEYNGYYWLGANHLARNCFRLMNDARPV